MGAGVVGGYFGAEDFLADMGGRHSATGLEVLYARSEVALAGRLAALPVIDQAVVAWRTTPPSPLTPSRAATSGTREDLASIPGRFALATPTFTPNEAEVAAARRVLDAAASGVAVVDGRMVDAVHTRLARQVIERAGGPDV